MVEANDDIYHITAYYYVAQDLKYSKVFSISNSCQAVMNTEQHKLYIIIIIILFIH